MQRFRKTLFWIHLIAGLVCGAIIFIMSFTGTMLAFEDELVAWAERDARRVEVPATAERLSLDQLSAAFATAYPDKTPSGITISADPAAAVTFAIGRDEAYYLNPYTGEIRQPVSTGMHDFMHTMVDWHRWLAREGDSRAAGKAITGASNTAFVVLAVTGLYLWWPRTWRLQGLRRSLWFMKSQNGKARDWNWHNVFGFWMLIPITVMSATGMVISYHWAGDLVYRVVGEEPPARRGPPQQARSGEGPQPGKPAGEKREAEPQPVTQPAMESYFTAIAADQPAWTSISLRLGKDGVQSAAVKQPTDWPRTASTTIRVNPDDRSIIERTTFADMSTGRQARSWIRFLHTGQSLGWWGQLIGALGCIAGCILVYTGFALSWRRFFGRKKAPISG